MKRNGDELEMPPSKRNRLSLRQQSLESAKDELAKFATEPIKTEKEALALSNAVCMTMSYVRNIVDPIYPRDEDGGEVVAMGTEDTMACGLIRDQEEDRLYEYEPTLIPEEKLDMKGDKTVIAVAAGGLHSACLHSDGTISTWGANDENALGRGDVDDDDTHLIKPMMFIPPGATEPAIFDNAIQISAGDNHTTVLDDKGDIYVSGMYKDMDSGKWRDLKTPTDTNIKGNHPYLHKVLGLPKVTIMDAGNSWNAALDVDQSTLYTWGMGNSGQLARSKSMGAELVTENYWKGDDKLTYQTYELKKPFMGILKEGNEYEYDRKKIRDAFLKPKPVEWANGFASKRQVLNFSCGDIHLLVVARNLDSFETQVFSAGNSAYGQLGHGDTKEVHVLTPIEALNNKQISKVAAGNFHSLAVDVKGQNVYAWGKIDSGSLGLYDEKKTLSFQQTDYEGTPKRVTFPNTLGKSCIVDIAAGDTSSFAITDTGAVYSWGYNENSQTGHYNVPGDVGKPDKHGNIPSNLIARPRRLDVIASVNDGIKKEATKDELPVPPLANNCRVTRVSGGGQHSVMVIKRYE